MIYIHIHIYRGLLLMETPVDSCEDVIEQCPTKIDRLGGNYFLAVELLTLVETGQGAKAGCGLAVCDIQKSHPTWRCRMATVI